MTHPLDSPTRQPNRPSTTDTSSLHYVVPGSPTLTNPDMILPDYEDSDSGLEPPLNGWQNAQVSDMEFQMHPQESFIAGPTTPNTPIIYGNGTMLSDIGEVTEAESNAGNDRTKRHISRLSAQNGKDGVLGQAGGHQPMKGSLHERRLSVESTDTITNEERPLHFADFDDSVSVDDSNFQGDDEQSMASSFRDDGGTGARKSAIRNTPGGGEERYSTHISKRAEEILANAKKRLTTMEGNLSRARSSLTSPSASDSSTPSPPGLRPSTAMRLSDRRIATAHSRDTSSENSSSSNPRANIVQRSASALGAAGGYRQPLSGSTNNSKGGAGAQTHKIAHARLNPTIELPGELENDPDFSGANHSRQGSGNSGSFMAPSNMPSNAYLDAGAPRATSGSQMRDLQDQMNGLKGKISSLKEKAIADSMKRRSLQSLRTPSPFTHARFEYGMLEPSRLKKSDAQLPISTEPLKPPPHEGGDSREAALESRSREGELISDSEVLPDTMAHPVMLGDNAQDNVLVEHEPINQEEQMEQFPIQGEAGPSGQRGSTTPDGAQEDVYHEDEYGEDLSVAETQNIEEDFADERSESGESIYEDTQQVLTQHGLSHEDRDDAFDYEHFFLHSAMGSMSRRNDGDTESWGSYDSDDSVETTRGPESHRRRPSTGSTSSTNTFATAREGRESRTSASSRSDTRQSHSRGQSSEESQDEDHARASIGFGRMGMASWRASKDSRSLAMHRPSVSSMESTGTTRSFPLVNRPKSTGAQITPVSSPEPQVKSLSRLLLGDTARMLDQGEVGSAVYPEAAQTLAHEDQVAVQMLVMSLGSCILGMGNPSTSNSSMHVYRQRLEMARRILEGQDQR